jgi:hypothetical protein
MFHCFKIPYFSCNFFTKFTYNEYIGPYFLSHVVLRFLPSDLPKLSVCDNWSGICGDDVESFQAPISLPDAMRCDATEVHWSRLLRTSIGVEL